MIDSVSIRLNKVPKMIPNIGNMKFDPPHPSASSWIIKRSLARGIRALGNTAFIR